ncbi:MAG: hypothetical protein HQ492_07730 [Woeseiaceae bacterium]|nr:hypothetical protein [Woeseiaceae bacterium]
MACRVLVTLASFDALFGRAHWLLAQHYVDMAKRSRDSQQYRNEGLYLWATIHHMERAVLWSNARMDRNLNKTLEELREFATDLRDPKLAGQVLRNKPVVRAEKVLPDVSAFELTEARAPGVRQAGDREPATLPEERRPLKTREPPKGSEPFGL